MVGTTAITGDGSTVKTSVSVPRHLLAAARERHINVSDLLRRALRDELALPDYEQLAQSIVEHPDPVDWPEAEWPK